MRLFPIFLTLVWALAGCAVSPPVPAQESAGQAQTLPQPPQTTQTQLPDVRLTGELLYRIVAAEMAANERQFDRASAWFLSLARDTSDPRFAHKALRAAVMADNMDRAQRAARQWLQISPNDPNAIASAVTLAAKLGRTQGMARALRGLIEGVQTAPGHGPDDHHQAMRQAAAIVNGLDDKRAALKVLEETLAPWQSTSSVANLMLADAAWQASQPQQALAAAQRAQQQAPDSEEIARRVLAYGVQADPAKTLAQARAFLTKHPESDRLGVQLAAALMEQDKTIEALQVLEQMHQHMPENVNLLRAQADLQLQGGNVEAAIKVLEQANQQQRVSNMQDADLQYELGMLYERVKRMEDFERMMQDIIEQDPEHANALNALGYTWVDENRRLIEARGLIERALQLEPDSPHILDSMGWYYFRTGDLAQARSYLERALQGMPAADVAAHLGEVLWQLGEREQAQTIWRSAWEQEDGNSVLRDTLQRYGVEP